MKLGSLSTGPNLHSPRRLVGAAEYEVNVLNTLTDAPQP